MIRKRKRQLLIWSYPAGAVTRIVDQARLDYPDLQWTLENAPRLNYNLDPLVQALRKPVTPIALFPIPFRLLPQLTERGWLQPLEGALSKDEWAHYDPVALELSGVKEHQYCLPDDVRPYALMIRKQTLEKAGLKPPTTWEALLDQVKYFARRRRGPVLGVAFGGYNPTLAFILSLLGSNGLDPRKGIGTLVQNEADTLGEAYEFVRELFHAGNVVDIRKSRHLRKGRLISRGREDAFYSGKMPFLFRSPSDVVRKPPEVQRDLALLHFPLGPSANRPCIVVHGNGWAIPHNTANLDLALDFLRAIGTPEITLENEMAGGAAFVALRSLWSNGSLLRRKPIYREARRLLGVKKAMLVEPKPEYLQLMDVFQDAIREDLPAEGWLERLAPAAPPPDSSHLHPAVASALRHIETHVEKITSIRQVAEAVRVNPNYLNTLFQQEIHSSCWAYIKKKRMERAKALLANPTLSIKEIAFRLKYAGVSSFSQVFTSHFKVCPRAMRTEVLSRLQGS